ncbi:hypothetical protein OG552_21855 [Streptomyces sp. NBC_01476]|uniref:tetratricopeptide repeat protein n=1 Tax=Streptomyces sp. NBC_01476 TaxID=2903881 RepID=UPI002E3623CA|nr:hypothetical protein [Streptomyces sp. NBC_01476]
MPQQAGSPETGTPPVTPVTPTTAADCVRSCTDYLTTDIALAAAGSGARLDQLAEALQRLLDLFEVEPAPSAAEDAPQDPGPGELTGKLFDALLAAGSKALECGPAAVPLAVVISDTVLTHRAESPAGWRLRGRTLEAAGDEAGAIDAYERYLARTGNDSHGVAAKVAGMRAGAERQHQLLRLLERTTPGAAAHSTGSPADLLTQGVALHQRGDRVMAEPRLVGALLAMERAGGPLQEMQQALDQYIDLRITAPDENPEALSTVIGLYADQRRHRVQSLLPDPLYGGVTWLSLGEFRNEIAGKSICLVANSQLVGDSSIGPQIDAYDLVVRFNSYRIDPAATGERTDIHVSADRHTFNWDQHVGTRLIFGGASGYWRRELRSKLVPGAQRYAGDESLRWPLRNVGRIGKDAWPTDPTSGFNMLWLLDFLDVSPRLDLIGFDFHSGGAYRLQRAMRFPLTPEHETSGEKAWVMERAQSVTDMVISLR